MKLKIGNIEQELKFMNKLYMENRFSEIVIRGQILNKKFPNIVPFYNILGLSYVKIGKDIFFINTYGFHYRILFYILYTKKLNK